MEFPTLNTHPASYTEVVTKIDGPSLEQLVSAVSEFQRARKIANEKMKESMEANGVAEALERQLREIAKASYEADEKTRILIQVSEAALKVAMEY